MKKNDKDAGKGPIRGGRSAARGRSRAPYRKSEGTRRRILDAAAHLFRRKGYAATSLRDIAGRANMISGSIYYHFASKEEILDAVLQEGIITLHAAVQNAVEALPKKSSPRERIAVAVRTHMAALLGQGDYIRANATEFERASSAIRKRNLVLRQNYATYWRGLLDQAKAARQIRDDVDLRLLRLFILGALHWSVDWYDPAKQPISQLADSLFKYFYFGVTTERDAMRG